MNRTDAIALGSRLKAARVARAWSLAELGAKVDLSPPMLSRLERGLVGASTDALRRVASALGLSLAGLLDEPDTTSVTIAGVVTITECRLGEPVKIEIRGQVVEVVRYKAPTD